MHYIPLYLLHTLHTITRITCITQHYTCYMLQLYSCSYTDYCCRSYTQYSSFHWHAVTCITYVYMHYTRLHALHALHSVTCFTHYYMIYTLPVSDGHTVTGMAGGARAGFDTLSHGRPGWSRLPAGMKNACAAPPISPGRLLSSWQGGSEQTFCMTRGIDC